MGAAVTGSLRASPSKRAAVTRKSSMPVAKAGSNVSGSGPLIMTKSAGGSERVQAARAKRAVTHASLRRRAAGEAPGARGRMLMNDYLFVPSGVDFPAGAGAAAEDWAGGRLESNDIPVLPGAAVD